MRKLREASERAAGPGRAANVGEGDTPPPNNALSVENVVRYATAAANSLGRGRGWGMAGIAGNGRNIKITMFPKPMLKAG